MREHIIFHLERLATLALPALEDISNHSDYSNEWDRSNDSQCAQRRGRQDSVAEDFEDLDSEAAHTVLHEDRGPTSEGWSSGLTDENLLNVTYLSEFISTSTWVMNLSDETLEPAVQDYPGEDFEPNQPGTGLPGTSSEPPDTLRNADQLGKETGAQYDIPNYQVVYRITCSHSETESGVFRDPPSVVDSGPHDAHARSNHRISNMEAFLEQNANTSFVVYREYACCGNDPPLWDNLHQDGSDKLNTKALFTREYIVIISASLHKAMNALGSNFGIPLSTLSQHDPSIQYPYTWWYHRRSQIGNRIAAMGVNLKSHLQALASYFQESLGEEWEVVDELLAGHRISAEYLPYLFVGQGRELFSNSIDKTQLPNEVIFSQAKGSDIANLEGFLLRDWAGITRSNTGKITVKFDSSHWLFEKRFERKTIGLHLERIPSLVDVFAITDLDIYPQRFASSETVAAMRGRGETFWKCRKPLYVESVSHSGNKSREMTVTRSIVDLKTYAELRPPSLETDSLDYLDDGSMDEEHPDLGDDFFMCLPTEVRAFDMQKKVWRLQKVAHIRDIVWNSDAFDLLVLEPGTKELIEATITHRMLTEDTDDIEENGDGLFILLHGDSGTGKTLTAECIAEFAKKPLYKLSVGDIGVTAVEIEQYLESTFHLAKIWDCVVLLDEADAFLEERRSDEIQRNAFVSIFLRAIEYYDGILILTSNRVRTFDRAFTSRIHLTLQYNSLSVNQRRRIWENILRRFDDLANEGTVDDQGKAPSRRRNIDRGVNMADIDLDELAHHDLNGREIRNAISTARQLAMFRGVPLNYEHLLRVVGEANKFQNSISLNQGSAAGPVT